VEEEKTSEKAAEKTAADLAAKLVELLDRAAKQKSFRTAYANNTRFEWSVWDLKIFFGELEQHTGTSEVDWHTAITIPWMQAKILDYYLRLNIAYLEHYHGPLKVSPLVVPSLREPPSEEMATSDPGAMELWEAYKKIHEEMFP
jgi:hypothetical protein